MDWISILLGLAPTLLGGLFGGGQQQPDIQKTSALSPEQEQVMKQLADLFGKRLGQNLPAYSGQLSAPLTPLQHQAMASVGDLIGTPGWLRGILPAMPTYQEATGPWSAALERVLSGAPAYQITPEASEQFYRAAVEAPALQTFREEILPSIQEEFVGPGTFWSSMRHEKQAKAASDLGAALAGERSKIMYADEQARRQAAEAGVQRMAGALPTALQYALQSSMQPFQAGMAAREQAAQEALGERQTWLDALQSAWTMGLGAQQTEQAGLTAAYNEWLRQQFENSPYLQAALQFLGIPAIAAYQPPYQPSPWAGILGLLGQIGAGWAQGGFKLPRTA